MPLGLDGNALKTYLETFHTEVRTQILNTIVASIGMQDFINTPQGRRLGDHYYRNIVAGISAIIALSLDNQIDNQERAKKVLDLGSKVGVYLDALKEMVGVISAGEPHLEKIVTLAEEK
jgi:hypothetical protein